MKFEYIEVMFCGWVLGIVLCFGWVSCLEIMGWKRCVWEDCCYLENDVCKVHLGSVEQQEGNFGSCSDLNIAWFCVGLECGRTAGKIRQKLGNICLVRCC